MKNILSHMYASRNVLFAVVVIIAALFGCDMPGPSPNPTPPRDTQAPSVAPAVELEGGRTLVNNATNVDPSSNRLTIRFSEAIRAVAGSTQVITLTIVDESAAATGANAPESQTFSVGNTEQVSIAGSDLSLLGVELGMGENYNLVIPLGAIADAAGNTVETQIMFATAITDSSNPTFMSSTPANDSFVAEIPTTVSLVFSENITINASTIQTAITISGGEAGGSESIGTVTVNAENAAQLDIAVSGLANNTRYTITVQSSAITDAAGNALQDNVVLRFTPDATAPVFEADMSTPANNAIVSAIPSTASLVFSENIHIVNPSTIQTVITISGGEAGGSESIGTVTVNAENAAQLDIALSGLADNTRYTITVPRTAIRDRAGNMPASDSELSFTTDGTIPRFETATPSNGSTVATIPSIVSFVYSESINIVNPSSIQTDITLSGGGGSESIGTVVVNAENANQLDIAVSGLADSTSYTVTVPRTALRDRAGNMPASDSEIMFSINTGALVLSVDDPTSDSFIRTVPTSIRLNFSREVVIVDQTTIHTDTRLTGGEGRIVSVVRDATNRNILNITLSGLEEGSYTVTIPSTALRDRSNNPPPEDIELSFTIDSTPPRLEGSTPDHNEDVNSVPSIVSLRFSEPLRIVDSSMFSITGSGTTNTESIDSSQVGGSTLELTVSGLGNEMYTITIPSASVSDRAGNNPANDIVRSFRIDTEGPVLREGSSIADNAVVNTNTIRFAFNENIRIANDALITLTGGTGSVSATGEGTSTLELSIQGNDGVYLVNIASDAITDGLGNPLANPINRSITLDTMHPSFRDSQPSTNSRVNAVPSPVTLEFSEPMRIVNDTLFTITGPGGESIQSSQPAGNTLELSLSGSSEGTYTITIPSASVSDQAGNNPENPVVLSFTLDSTIPVFERSVPVANTTVSTIPSTVSLVFSEPIRVVDSVAITLSGGTGSIGTVAPNASNSAQLDIAVSGLADNTSYTLTVPRSAISDLAGNLPTGDSAGNIEVMFSINTAAFTFVDSNPSANSVINVLPTSIRLEFSREVIIVDSTTIQTAITLNGGLGSIGTVTTDSMDRTVLNIEVSGLEEAEYTLTVPSTAIRDTSSSNPPEDIEIVFTTDTTSPMLSDSTPSHNDRVNIPPATVTIEFNEDIEIRNSGLFTIADSMGVTGSIDDSRVVDGTNLVLEVSGLGAETYTVTIPVASIADTAGNSPDSDITRSFTIDTTAPRADSFVPDHNSRINTIPSTVSILFDKDIEIVGAASISTDIILTGTPGSITTASVDGSNPRMLNIEVSGFSEGSYTLTVPRAVIRDTARNNPTNDTEVSFTIDTTAPSFNNSTPVHESQTNMIPNSIALFFNEDMRIVNEGTIASDITLTGSPGSIGTVSVNAMNPHRLDIALDSFGETVYGITLPASAVSDTAGNPLASNVEVSFTVDRTSPAFLDSTPTNNSRQNTIPSALTLRFNEDIHIVNPGSIINEIDISGGAGTVTNAVVNNARQNELSINLSGLVSNTTYTISVPQSSLRDSAGNNPTNSVEVMFTIETELPVFDRSIPENGSTVLSVPSEVTFVFNEPIEIVNDNDIILGGGSGSITGSTVDSVNSNELDIAVSGLADQTTYTLTVRRGAIQDSAGNMPLEDSIVSFTINTSVLEHNEAMSVPAHNSLVQTAPSPITFVFSRDIEIVDRGNIRDLIGITGGTAGSVTVTNVEVDSTNRNELDIFLSGLASNTTYTISVPRTAVRDTGNNTLMSNADLTFSLDSTAPMLEGSMSTPAHNSFIGTAPGASDLDISLVFSEEVRITDPTNIRSAINLVGPGGSINTSITTDPAENSLNLVLNTFAEGMYTITVQSTALQDRAGNTPDNNVVLSFSIDNTDPVFMTSPENNSRIRGSSHSVSLVFSEIMGSVDSSAITLTSTPSGGSVDSATINATNGNTIDIALSGLVEANYVLTVPSTALGDRAGNNPTSAVTVGFGIDNTAPMVTGRSPMNNAIVTTVPANITVTFNENIEVIDSTTILSNITLTGGTTGNITMASVDPARPNQLMLIPSGLESVPYTLSIESGVVRDTAGNILNEAIELRFTVDTREFALLSTDPDHESVITTIPSVVSFIFNRNINPSMSFSFLMSRVNFTGPAGMVDSISINSESATTLNLTLTGLVDGEYTITLLENDITYDPLPGESPTTDRTLSENAVLSFTIDTTAPIFQPNQSVPVHDTTVDTIPTSATLVFSENIEIVDATTIASAVTLAVTPSGRAGSIGTVEVDETNANELNISLIDLADRSTYTITVPQTAIRDSAGNMPAGDSMLRFGINTTALALNGADSQPVHNSTVQTAPTTVTLRFNQEVRIANPGSIRNEIDLTGGTGTVGNVSVGSNNNELNISLSGLDGNATYTLTVPLGSITDSVGANPPSNAVLSFTIDSTAPTLQASGSMPAVNAFINTAPSTITLNFSEDIVINESGSAITLAGGGSINMQNASSSTLVLTVSGLSDGLHTVNIPANAITDRAGNPLAADASHAFTLDTVRPVFQGSPADNAVLRSGPITLNFSEPVNNLQNNQVTLTGPSESISLVSPITNGLTVSIATLPEGNYTLSITGSNISDSAGNTAASDVSISFRIDRTAPTFVSSTPSNGQVIIGDPASFTTISLVFSEEVNPPSISSLRLTPVMLPGTIEGVVVNATNRNQLDITVSGLGSGTYRLQTSDNNIRDLALFNLEDDIDISFTLTPPDSTPPMVENTSFIPRSGTLAPPGNVNVFLTIDEVPRLNPDGEERFIRVRDGENEISTIVVSDLSVGRDIFSERVLTFTVSLPNHDTTYTIVIDGGAIQDSVGNDLAEYSFDIETTQGPLRFLNSTPENNATISAGYREIILTFSRSVFTPFSAISNAVTITDDVGTPQRTSSSTSLARSGSTISYGYPFEEARTYTLTFNRNALFDSFSGGMPISEDIVLNITVRDSTPPELDFVSVNNARTLITLEFNEDINFADSTVSSFSLEDSSRANVGISNIAPSGTSNLQITVDTALTEGESYTLSIPSNAIADTDGNAFAATDRVFTADTIGPGFMSDSINEGGSEITIAFNENVSLIAAGSFELSRNENDGSTTPITITASDPTTGDNEILLSIDSAFIPLANGDYTIRILENAVRDTARNGNGTITEAFLHDTVQPTLENIIGSGNSLTLVFSEEVTLLSAGMDISNYSIFFTGRDSSASLQLLLTGFTITQGSNANEIVITRGTGMFTDSNYALSIPASAVRDGATNANNAVTERAFSIDTVAGAPALSETTPPSLNAGRTQITLSFAEEIHIINAGTIASEIQVEQNVESGTPPQTSITSVARGFGSNANELTLTLSAALDSHENYTITIPAGVVEDNVGLDNSEIQYTFPFRLATNPIDYNSIQSFTLAFSRNITLLEAGNISLVRNSDSTEISTTVAAGANGNELLITLGTAFTTGAEYTLTISEGAVRDANMIENRTIVETFTATVETTRPTITNLEQNGTDIVITFSEPITLLSLAPGANHARVQQGLSSVFNNFVIPNSAVTSATVITIPMSVYNITLQTTLEYTVTIFANSIRDALGNTNIQLSDTFTAN